MSPEQDQLNLAGLFPDFSNLGVYPETAEQLSTLFVAVLISVAIFFFVVSFIALLKALIRTSWLRRLLQNETSQTVVKSRQSLREKASKIRNGAGHLWKEFDETLVEAKVGEEIHLHNIYDADHFFNSSTLARGITESRMLAAVPGFLTALGVIGTFVGLQLGLSELNIGNNVAVQEMKDGLAHVISGAKIAFMTSVWGVTLSVLFNFIEKWFESLARTQIHSLQIRIDELFPRFSAEGQLQKIAEDGSESREALQGMAERIGQKMQESMIEATSGIQRGLEEALEKIMAPAIEKLVSETTDGSQKALEQLVEGFLGKFGEQGAAQRKAMDDASQEVGKALASMNQTMDSFVGNLREIQGAAAHRETELAQKFATVVTGMTKSLARQASTATSLMEQGKALQQQVEGSQADFKELASRINDGASELRSAASILKEYGEGVRLSTEELAGEIRGAAVATSKLASENQKSATAVSQVHQQLSQDIQALNEVARKMSAVVQTADSTFSHLEEHQRKYLAALKVNVQELAEHGAKLLEDYAERANAQTKTHLDEWAKHTTAYAEQMNRLARALSAVVDEIEDKLRR